MSDEMTNSVLYCQFKNTVKFKFNLGWSCGWDEGENRKCFPPF